MYCLDPRESYDKAIVGVMRKPDMDDPVAVYDQDKVFEVLATEMGMESREESEEWFDFNMIGASVGPQTPVYLLTGDEAEFFLENAVANGEMSEEMEAEHSANEFDGIKPAGVWIGFGGSFDVIYKLEDIPQERRNEFVLKYCTLDSSPEAMKLFEDQQDTEIEESGPKKTGPRM